MSSQSVWGNEEKTIIYRPMSSLWTWDEFLESCEEEQIMAKFSNKPVSLIVDLSQTLTLPVGSLGYFKRALEDCCEQCEKQILISKNQAFWTLHRLLIQMMPEAKDRFFIVRTKAEAYQLVQEHTQEPLAS